MKYMNLESGDRENRSPEPKGLGEFVKKVELKSSSSQEEEWKRVYYVTTPGPDAEEIRIEVSVPDERLIRVRESKKKKFNDLETDRQTTLTVRNGAIDYISLGFTTTSNSSDSPKTDTYLFDDSTYKHHRKEEEVHHKHIPIRDSLTIVVEQILSTLLEEMSESEND